MPESRSPRPVLTLRAQSRGAAPAVLAAAALLWALAGAAAAGDGAAVKAPVVADTGQATVTTVVAGIVSYTRWPIETKSIRLCTIGKGRGVDELLAAADLGSPQLSVPVHAAKGAAAALDECDAIYVGALAGNATRSLLHSAVGRPVLMIGEGQEFCTDGGMFCLQPAAAAVGFAVNLDAVARSGLRVNPRVLRMARSATGGAP
jgi:YfiR/HmsC-like